MHSQTPGNSKYTKSKNKEENPLPADSGQAFLLRKNKEENPLPADSGRAFLLRKNKED